MGLLHSAFKCRLAPEVSVELGKAKSLGGLITCYTLALPFFRNALEGDLLFTAAMFATPLLTRFLADAFAKHDHTAAA